MFHPSICGHSDFRTTDNALNIAPATDNGFIAVDFPHRDDGKSFN
jgi:hypothetical protein